MRLTRIVASAVAALATAVALAAVSGAPAQAVTQPHPSVPPSLSLSESAITVGMTVTLFGEGFGPNEIVDIVATVTPLAAGVSARNNRTGATVAMVPVASQQTQLNPQVTASAEGRFEYMYEPKELGRITHVATGRDTGRTATAVLTLCDCMKALPKTSSAVGRSLAVGAGLVLSGLLLVMLTIVWHRRTGRRSGLPATAH